MTSAGTGYGEFTLTANSGLTSGIIVKLAYTQGDGTVSAAWGSGDNTLTITVKGNQGGDYTLTQEDIDAAVAAASGTKPDGAQDLTVTLSNDVTFGSTATTNNALVTLDATKTGAGKEALTLQVGDTYQDYNMLKVSIGDMHAAALGGRNNGYQHCNTGRCRYSDR